MRLPVDRWVKKFFFYTYAPFGWARSPNHVSLDITRRCNLRCQMCFYYGGEDRPDLRLKELSSEEIISRVVNRLEGVDYDITGGEPLVRTDLVDLLAAIRNRKAAAFLTTNGTLMTPELARRMVNEELLRGIHFSIHGLRKTHDEITRVKNSFDRALRGIEMMLTERARKGGLSPEVTIACTISGLNMKEMEGMVKLAEEMNVDQISFGHASFMPPEVQTHHQEVLDQLGLSVEPELNDLVQGAPEFPVHEEEVKTYARSLSRLRHSSNKARVKTSPEGYEDEDIRRHFLDLNWKYKSTCAYSWRNLRIGPDGTVTPCIGYRIGNVKDQDIRQLWNHPRFRKFRSTLFRKKLFPGCIRCCKLK